VQCRKASQPASCPGTNWCPAGHVCGASTPLRYDYCRGVEGDSRPSKKENRLAQTNRPGLHLLDDQATFQAHRDVVPVLFIAGTTFHTVTSPAAPIRRIRRGLVTIGPLGAGHAEIRAVVNWYGATDLTDFSHTDPNTAPAVLLRGAIGERLDFARFASPVHRVHPGAPPFLSVHGTADTIVPYRQSEALAIDETSEFDRIRMVTRSAYRARCMAACPAEFPPPTTNTR
jgi:hypothetical protein